MTKDLSYFRILLRKGDTPAGTVTGTEFDEVRGGLRSELSRRAGVDEVMAVLELFDTRYWDFTARHFWEKPVREHGFERSYNWVRLSLQAHGRITPAPRRGAHRRKRPRRPLVGMMLHQDGSSTNGWRAGSGTWS